MLVTVQECSKSIGDALNKFFFYYKQDGGVEVLNPEWVD